MASYFNKRSRVSSEAVTGDGDLVSDVKAGRTSFSAIKDDDLPENLRDLKPEQRMDELNKQMNQRKALNEKLGALVAKRDKFVAEARDKAPPKALSFDRVVEDTLKAQRHKGVVPAWCAIARKAPGRRPSGIRLGNNALSGYRSPA